MFQLLQLGMASFNSFFLLSVKGQLSIGDFLVLAELEFAQDLRAKTREAIIV